MENKDQVIVTRLELKRMEMIVANAISQIYNWRRRLDKAHSSYLVEKGIYEEVIFPITDPAQELKTARDKLGQLSCSEKILIKDE